MDALSAVLCCRKKSEDEQDGPTSKKPSDSAFKQQKMKAWQPILTASTVLPIFFLFGILFLPIGIALLSASDSVKEQTIEYTNCKNVTTKTPCEQNLEKSFKKAIPSACTCVKKFTLKEKWEGNVFFYYGLSNFYQNHRRYVKSRDDNQLHGSLGGTVGKRSSGETCDPYRDIANIPIAGSNDTKVMPVAPCGAVANSMFNDKFALTWKSKPVPMTHKGIAWNSDLDSKFANPEGNVTTGAAFAGFIKPATWTRNVWELDSSNPENNGFLNEDFIVWMRVAAFPTFRKFYRKLVRAKTGDFKDGLPAGDYELTIDYNFPVIGFEGEKRFILSTSSWIGGKNHFLAIAYIVVGCLCLIFGFIFLFIHLRVRTRETGH